MSLSIHPDLESKIRGRADAEGLTVETYLERLVGMDQEGAKELESLALEGLQSGDPINPDATFWEKRHRQLDERLSQLRQR